ncbi:MAG: S49 family peptidase [Phycisphaeraceae bacterium]
MSDSQPTQDSGSPRKPIDPKGTSAPPPPPPGYVPAVYVQQPSGSSSAVRVGLYLLLVALLVSITLNVYLFGPVKAIAKALGGGLDERPYNAQIEPTNDKNRVVVVHIEGMIDGPTAEFTRQAFHRLEEDPPGAVVLRVESGGGYVTPSDQMWHAIMRFKKEHPKVPVIASFGNLAASGGYYVAAPADYIFCERTTITGSIGVMANIPAAGGLMEKLGLEVNVVVADGSPNKDHGNNPFIQWYDDQGNLTEEGKESMDVVKNMLNESYDTFLTVVKEGRTAANKTITAADMEAAATGEVFQGKEALEAKLVDKIGYLDDAIEYARDKAGIKEDDMKVTVLEEPSEGMLSGLFARRRGVDATNLQEGDLQRLADDAMGVRLQYRASRYR